MTYQDKVKWLGRYRRAVQRQEYLAQQLQELHAEAERVTALLRPMPGRTGVDTDRLPRAVERIEQAEDALRDQINQCCNAKLEVMEVIAREENPARREVLRQRYILGREYDDIADALGVVKRRVFQLHKQAMETLEL